jgi:hypothetical protein
MKRYISLYENINFTNWDEYTLEEIKIEYNYEWLTKWPSEYYELDNLFPTLEKFYESVKKAKIINYPLDEIRKIDNTTTFKTLEQLDNFVQSYVYPRPVYELANAFENNKRIPYPIVCKFNNTLRILSGNTRMNICYILQVPLKIKLLDLDKLVKNA